MRLADLATPGAVRAAVEAEVYRAGRAAFHRFAMMGAMGGPPPSLSELGYVAGLVVLLDFFGRDLDGL